MPSVISVPIDLKVQKKTLRYTKQDYLIFVAYWSKELDFKGTYCRYSPSKKNMIVDKFPDGQKSMIDQLKDIKRTSGIFNQNDDKN